MGQMFLALITFDDDVSGGGGGGSWGLGLVGGLWIYNYPN